MMLRIFRHFVPVSAILLSLCELILVFAICQFFLPGNAFVTTNLDGITPSSGVVLAGVAGLVMAITGLYHYKAFSDFRVIVVQVTITFGTLAALTLVFSWYKQSPLYSLEAVAEALVTCILLILITRVIYVCLTGLDLLKKNVLVLGTGGKATRIAELAAAPVGANFVPVAYLRCGGGSRDSEDPDAFEAKRNPDLIAERARQLGAREIVVATDDRRGLPVEALLRCRAAGIRVVEYLDFIERQTKTVDLAALQPGWLIFSDGFRGSGLASACKRLFDILLSLALLLATLPLMLLTSLLILLDSPGPLLYRQERVGLAGRRFMLLKFRSMCVDAEKDGAPRWASVQDPRVTRVGGLIRKLRIDELPQLFNVLRGDMSIVGPRPERPAFVEEFTGRIPFYAERHYVKPGITGWAQINYPYGASLEDARHKLAYDLYYAKNHSLFLDIVIVFQTARVVLWADGAR